MMKTDKNRRIAVFASYSKNNRIADYVVYYLKELHKVVSNIIFVSDNEMEPDETDKLSGIVSKTICLRHDTYDFGSYRIGYYWALENGLLDNTDELVLANDSCYGPVFPFENVFEKMGSKLCDFWGLTDSYEDAHHILSFFLVFKRNVFTSKAFHNFMSGITHQKEFMDYVRLYERKLTEKLEQNQFRSAVYIEMNCDTRSSFSIRAGNGNLTVFPVSLFDRGMPLVKVKAMNGTYGMDLQESPCLLMRKIKSVNPDLYFLMKQDLHNKSIVQEDRWQTPEDIIGDANVISFDIFDTLLDRPYINPTDLFLHIEKVTGIKGFQAQRIKAEKKARRRHRDQADVTFDQIYEELDAKYASLKQEELRYEKELLYPKKDAKTIYDEAVKAGKTIIAVSDMYLPQAFLEEVLQAKGYTKISHVFVSNAENCCKGDGGLFRKVMEYMNIEPSDMVHIGDNYESDKRAPEQLGIRAYYRPTNVQKMFASPAMAKFKFFSKTNPDLSTSIVTGLYARHYAENTMLSAFMELGYYMGGPLAVGYCQHIHKVAKERGNDAIIFVSRDGYALHQVYRKMYSDEIPSYYVYASRNLILRNSIDDSVESYFKNVCSIYSKECLQGTMVTKDNFPQHKEAMEQWATVNAKKYQQYIDSLHIAGQKIMTVDMTTRAYTSLNMMHRVFGNRIDCGIFSLSGGLPCEYTALSYSKKTWDYNDFSLLVLQEELITAPERQAQAIDDNGNIIFSVHNPIEDYKIEKYKEILAGVELFADDFIKLTTVNCPHITYDFWNKLYHAYIHFSNFGDHELLKLIYHDDIEPKTFRDLYSVCINKKILDDEEEVKLLYKKNKKRLKRIRLLIWTLCVETAILVALLLAWLL